MTQENKTVFMVIGKDSVFRKAAIDVMENLGLAISVITVENGKKALEYLKSSFKGDPKFPQPLFLLLDMEIGDMSAVEFLMNYSNYPVRRRNNSPIYIYTEKNAAHVRSVSKVYEFVKGVINQPLTEEVFRSLVTSSRQKSIWPSWLKSFPIRRIA